MKKRTTEEIKNKARIALIEAYEDTLKKFPQYDKNKILYNAIQKYVQKCTSGVETPLTSELKGDKLTDD